jgi:hypothetical protein
MKTEVEIIQELRDLRQMVAAFRGELSRVAGLPPFLTQDELAERLHTSPRAALEEAKRNGCRVVKFGSGPFLIVRVDVEGWLDRVLAESSTKAVAK